MTTRTKVGLSNADRLRRTYPENSAYPVLNTELAGVFDVLKATAQSYLTGYPSSPGYTAHPSILADHSIRSIPLHYVAHPDFQFVKASGPPNSIPFPPFYYWEQEWSPAPNIFM